MSREIILYFILALIIPGIITIYAAIFDIKVMGHFYAAIGYRLLWAIAGIIFFSLGKSIWG